MTNNPSYVADEDIDPALFVKLKAGEPFRIVKCGANDLAVGVTHNAPYSSYPGLASYPAVLADKSCRIHGMGETCEVKCGAAVTAGAFVKPDANAKAVTCSSTDEFSGWAMNTTANADEFLRVYLEQGVTP